MYQLDWRLDFELIFSFPLARVLCISAQKYTLRGMQSFIGFESNYDLECTFHRETHLPAQ